MRLPERFADLLAAVRPEIERELDRLLPAANEPPARLHEAMRYAVFAGGKRLRPALVLLATETAGGERALALAGAAAIELIHTYSLVHDDLPALDDDDWRRGRPAVHREFDEPTAILVGDALLTLGLTTLAREPHGADPRVRAAAVELVGAAIGSGGMIGGQHEDLAAEDSWPTDAAAALARIHRGKTAALIAACCELGGLYSGVEAAARLRLHAFGARLGLIFQVADDILDIVGTDEALGKTAGKDAQAHKLTYPALYGLAASRAELEQLQREAIELGAALPGPDGLWRSLVELVATRNH